MTGNVKNWIVGVVAGVILLLIYLFAANEAHASEGQSIKGDSSGVTVTLNTARDSVWVIFSYPDNNPYDSLLCLPRGDSATAERFLVALDPVTLDSVGCHNYLAK